MGAYLEIQFISIAITVLLLICGKLDRSPDTRQQTLMDTMLWLNLAKAVCYAVTIMLTGRTDQEALYSVMTFFANGLGFPMIAVFALYIKNGENDDGKPAPLMIVCFAICTIAVAANIWSIFSGMIFNCRGAVYQRGPLFLINFVMTALALGAELLLVAIHRAEFKKRELISIFTYGLPLLIALILQLMLPPELDTISIGLTLSLMLVYITIHIDRGKLLAEKEKELTEANIAIMLSQIQPHFLYNALSAIQDLCHGLAPEAEEATIEFAEFLRGNLDSLKARAPIPFEKELRHTQNYLSLEKRRFGSMLNVEYDIQATDFLIPALTLQPIVENAVRYGVMKKENGGTVKISSRCSGDGYLVTISDDGAGFDVLAPKPDGRTHIGIKNVGERLESICGGSLNIASKQGEGTMAVLFIPKEERNEDPGR